MMVTRRKRRKRITNTREGVSRVKTIKHKGWKSTSLENTYYKLQYRHVIIQGAESIDRKGTEPYAHMYTFNKTFP